MTNEDRKELHAIKRLCVEIGLETFGRRGPDLVLTAQHEKLAMMHKMVREIDVKVSTLLQEGKSKYERS